MINVKELQIIKKCMMITFVMIVRIKMIKSHRKRGGEVELLPRRTWKEAHIKRYGTRLGKVFK